MLTTKNWRALLAWLAPAVMLVAALAGCTPPGPRALLEGERLIRAGKYSEAIESLQLATRILPSNAQAWNHLGLAFHKAGQPHNALKAYEQARRCDMNLTPVRYNLGCLLLEQNNVQPAIAELTAYTLLEEDSADGWLQLAAAQLRARQWDAAERSYRKALQLRSDLPQAWNALGMIQTQRKRPKDALACFNAALQKEPAYAPAVLNSAILHQHHLKNPDLALQKYEEYLQLAPAARDASLIKEIVRHLRAGLAAAARQDTRIAAAPPESSTSAPSETLPGAAPSVSTPPVAATQAPAGSTRSAETSPASPQRVQPAEVAQTGSQPEKPPETRIASPTRAEVARAAALPPVQPPQPASSRAELPQEIPPTPPETAALTPGSDAASTTVPATEPPKTDVIQLNEEPPVKLAEDRAPAVPLPQPSPVPSTLPEPPRSETFVRADPPAPEARTVLDRLNPANWFKPRRQGAPALTPLESAPRSEAGSSLSASSTTAARSEPVEQMAWANIPRYGYRPLEKPATGDRFKAQGHFTQAVEAHRDRRLAEAMASYQQAIALDPSFFEAHYNLGLAAYESKDRALSLSAYETALSINPTSANCRYNFALALEQAGYFLDAADELEKLLAQHPDEARAHLTLASLYADALAKPVLARPHYRKVLELDPQNSQAPAIRYWLAANP